MLGLKRGMVELYPHQESWEQNAREVIAQLKELLSGVAIDIQHIGSTAILGIHAKPIIDIVVGVHSLRDIMTKVELLEKNGIIFRKEDVAGQLLFVMGDFEADTRTHHIHVVEWNGTAWNNYINFRDYMNAFPDKAKEYDCLKQELLVKFADNRVGYTNGKQKLIDTLLDEAREWKLANLE